LVYDELLSRAEGGHPVKLLIEIVISIVLHPLAVVLAWINILGRSDLSTGAKVGWFIIVTFAWGIGPILYVLAGDGTLW
jgi:hypothetical protein